MKTQAHPSKFAISPLATEALIGPVIDASLDAVVIADLEGYIVRVNPATDAMFGHAPGSMIGQSIGDALVPIKFRAAHERGMAHHAKTGERKVIGQRLELEALHAAGHSFPIEIQIEEILQGEQRVYAAFIRDLSERRAMEAEVERQRERIHQQEKLSALGAMLGGVAHELNNPLAVVIGRAAILEDVLAGTTEEKTVIKLREAADRCARIIRTFLAMARDAKPRLGQVNLNELLAGALEFTGYDLRNSKISVSTEFDSALPVIQGDHDQLVQAFVGLIVNAQQALDQQEGLRTLTVSTALDGQDITVRFADNGPGIPADVQARVFEPFFTTKAFGDGGGSGLAIARGIVESHHGSIALEGAAGGGCTILVTLPTSKGESQ